jgi:hypothetical protein
MLAATHAQGKRGDRAQMHSDRQQHAGWQFPSNQETPPRQGYAFDIYEMGKLVGHVPFTHVVSSSRIRPIKSETREAIGSDTLQNGRC